MEQANHTAFGTRLIGHDTATTGYCGVFAVPTPVEDDSGVAHVVEHLVFRSSPFYPHAHNLFAGLVLLPLKINATTQSGVTYYFIEADNAPLFSHALRFVYAGLLNQSYTADDLRREKDGVIFQELAFYERQPEYAEHLAELIKNGKVAEACTGGFTGTLATLLASNIQAYKSRWYQPGQITLLINQGDLVHIATLLDETVLCVLPDCNAMRASTDKALRPRLLPPDHDKISSPAMRALIDVFVEYYAEAHPANVDSLPLCQISQVTRKLNRCRQQVFPPLSSNNLASFVCEIKHRFPALPGLSLTAPPTYILRCWPQFTCFVFCENENENGDWYYAFPFSEKIRLPLEQLLLGEAFWSPRISGDCYAMGVSRVEDTIIIYAVNDVRSGDRARFCELLYKQLFG